MKILDVTGHEPVLYKLPVYAASAALVSGSGLMPGVTAETDLGTAILTTGAGADFIGICKEAVSTSVDCAVNGTAWKFADVEISDRYSVLQLDYDQSDTMAVASTSGTTVTITSLEDNIDTSWLYSTVTKTLFFIDTSASGSCTTKTATGWTSADTVIKILRIFHPLVKLNSAATGLGTDAAAGSWTVCVLENWFEDTGYPLQMLDPTKHNGITLVNPRFYSKLIVRNTCGHTID